MADKDTYLAVENAVEQLEQAPAIVQDTHKLKYLLTGFRTISMLLKEVDGQEYEPGVADWLNQVRDVAYETQDLIGSIDSNYQKQSSKLGRWLSGRRAKHGVEEIDKIEKRIGNICQNKEYYRSHSSKIGEVVGFDDAHETLVRQLIDDAKSQCKIILIHGKAGSGKTTLAKMICYESIQKHFDYREWMSFPQELPIEDLLCRILKQNSSASNQTDCLSKDELKVRFCESLKGKRYLVVIDSVQNNDELDELMSLFPDESNGSRILLASRVPPEALHVKQRLSFSYEIKPLDVSQSWQLLSQKLFDGENHSDLEKLGKKMAEKCNGSPRAIVAMAAILDSAEKTEKKWSEFLKGYAEPSNYEKLPGELKLCLLYFGLFPEGLNISAKQMIQMWMAEGLLKQNGNKAAEEIGEDYLKKLIDQSFIIHTKRADESVKTCRAVSRISDFCKSTGAAEKFLEVHKNINTKPQTNIKRVAIDSKNITEVMKSLGDYSAHTLHCFGENNNLIDFWETVLNFSHLWVLNLGSITLDKVPKGLGRLTNLRYLRLKAPSAKHLPSSIVRLHKLETLDLRESSCLVRLPDGIWKMQCLRHLYLGGSTSLPQTSGIDYYRALPNLQTLSGIYSDKILKWLMVRGKFPNVRKLRICSFDEKLTLNFLNSLDHLYHLQSLRVEKHTKLPDLNAFPLSLTKLTLLETQLPPESIETLEKLPNLRILKLLEKAISEEEIKCNEGGFLQLEVLYIEDLTVKKWTLGKGAMQFLKRFSIKNCNNDILETAPDYLIRVLDSRGMEPNDRNSIS